LGGVPASGSAAQSVVAFVDREGGSFFQEWSALFVAEEESGGRVCFYYPRLSPNPGSGSSGLSWDSAQRLSTSTGVAKAGKTTGVPKSLRGASAAFVREEFEAIVQPLSAISLRASFLAFPYVDTNDGQTVLCYRSYFPAAMAAAY
jgi:hypothetical protein